MTTQDSIPASEAELIRSIHRLSDAGAAVIQIRTREPYRAASALRKHFHVGRDASPYREWDCINGMRVFTETNFQDPLVGPMDAANPMHDLHSALGYIMDQRRDQHSNLYSDPDHTHYFVYVNPAPFMDMPPTIELVCQLATTLPSTNACVLIITYDAPLSMLPQGTVQVAHMETPSHGELVHILDRILDESRSLMEQDESTFPEGIQIEDEEVEQIAHMGAGMAAFEFETYVAISVIEAQSRELTQLTAEVIMEGVSKGKTEVVKQSDVLELLPSGDIQDVGGMEGLKEWISQRSGCYSDEAREFGIEPPKGIALVGVPGAGKSLVAKAISSVLGIPLVRFDFGRVFSKFVGDSEARMHSALKMVESMAPIVLFADEIDKALGGATGGGDSGTSSRVLGAFLTWLQECKAPVFTLATANRVDGLPPELLRKGRFDQIFSVGMPSPEERENVLAIHLRKRGRDIEDFDANDLLAFANKSEGFVGAEIESAVRDGLVLAFHAKESLEMKHIVAALEDTVPMSVSNKARIDAIVEWAKTNATPVSKRPTVPPSSTAGNVRRLGRRTTTRSK